MFQRQPHGERKKEGMGLGESVEKKTPREEVPTGSTGKGVNTPASKKKGP